MWVSLHGGEWSHTIVTRTRRGEKYRRWRVGFLSEMSHWTVTGQISGWHVQLLFISSYSPYKKCKGIFSSILDIRALRWRYIVILLNSVHMVLSFEQKKTTFKSHRTPLERSISSHLWWEDKSRQHRGMMSWRANNTEEWFVRSEDGGEFSWSLLNEEAKSRRNAIEERFLFCLQQDLKGL
jgi:hypothetical protein